MMNLGMFQRCSMSLVRIHRRRAPMFSFDAAARRHRTDSSWNTNNNEQILSTTATTTKEILSKMKDGTLSIEQAETILTLRSNTNTNIQQHQNHQQHDEQILHSFAELDHDRSIRTGFPEVIYGENKTVNQIALILDDMAKSVNDRIHSDLEHTDHDNVCNSILATRVSPEIYHDLSMYSFKNGSIKYHTAARIVTMKANALENRPDTNFKMTKIRVAVVTAGTTDIPVSEEAAKILEEAGYTVDRIYDCGVAGLHRIIRALHKLTHPDVHCVIVCAGMDGALPSVVGGLVRVPVIAVPTSIGYGASFGGVSALLTMLNTCSPGVAVVNIDNGFGAAAFAHKCISSLTK